MNIRFARYLRVLGLLMVIGALALAGGAATIRSGGGGTNAPVARTALVNTGSGSEGTQETEILNAQGFTVTAVTDAAWSTMTASQFAAYDLLVLPDPLNEAGRFTPPGVKATASVWGPVVLGTAGGRTIAGNRIVIGTDTTNHSGGSTTDRATIMREGIAFAGAVSGATGMYFTGYYDQAGGPDTVATLDAMSTGTGAWTINQQPPCGGNVSLIAAHPAFTTLSTASLEGWGCSVHASFPTFRSDWSALAVATDTPSHPTCGIDPGTSLNACGEAYIIVAGSAIRVGSEKISVSPLDATNRPGTNHTVTANVHQVGGTPVIAGQHVDFLVTGVNSGATGTCAPVDCKSDSAGNVAFTYTGGPNEGDDTIKASFSDSVGSLQAATAQKHWVNGGSTNRLDVTVAGTGSGSVASNPTGIACPTTCSHSYATGTMVTLTPTPAAGSTFTTWSGACTGTGACVVTLNSDQTVTATFTGGTTSPIRNIDGNGRIVGTRRTVVDIDVDRSRTGVLSGSFDFEAQHPGAEFDSTRILTLSGTRDKATVTGEGKWNNHSGYTFTLGVRDNHDNPLLPDRAFIEVKNASGVVVFTTGLFHTLPNGDIDIS